MILANSLRKLSSSIGKFTKLSLQNYRFLGTKYAPKDLDENKPTVVILGWAYSLDKNVAKFSQLYSDFGYQSIRFTMPGEHFFEYNHGKQKELAIELLKEIKETCPSGKIIVHTLSNNGYAMYTHLNEQLKKEGNLKITAGIFDSGPRRINLKPDFILNLKSLEQNVIPLKICLALFNSYIFYFTQGSSMMQTFKIFQDNNKKVKKNWNIYRPLGYVTPAEYCVKEKQDFPVMFLYSCNDVQAPPKYFEIMAKKFESENRSVMLHDFGPKSDHVEHLRRFPKIYKEKLETFLKTYVEKQ